MLEKYRDKLKKEKVIYLRIKVNPGMEKTSVKSIMDDETIKIDVSKAAERGKANEELLKFLAKEFKIDRNNVKIISGVSNRVKLIKINN